MTRIENMKRLLENGGDEAARKARAIALRSLEYALNAVNPKKLLQSKLSLSGGALRVEDFCFELQKFRRVYVVGGGKAAGQMAEGLEEILGNYITAGIVNVPHGSEHKARVIELHGTSHPVPDEAGVDGVRRMMEIADQAGEDDLVICLLSGGGSSLMPLPREGLSLEDKKATTAALLRSGASIGEINVVRKHLSAFKGGWLAKTAYPATVLNLVLSDVVGDPLDAIASGPTVPDPSSFTDARKVLEKYSLWETAPSNVRRVLSDGEKGLIAETPKPSECVFERVHSVVVGNNRTACVAAVDCLKADGLNTLLLTAMAEGEARHVGTLLASVAREIAASGNPVGRPAAVVAGGETTVTVTGQGRGGRNQELALSAALCLRNAKACVVACLSTDGVDGPTDAAGAVVDGATMVRAMDRGLEPERFLAENDSYHFFQSLGDLIFTGQTGTNVNDISVIVVL
ncbi:MAG: glycerate kinase [Candidatus Bathyarchaeia archaeon]